MMNIVQLQDQLKNFSQDQLVREMQMPSGNAPQFLVLGEIMRRQKMQQDFTAQQAKGDQGTVAQEAVAAAGVPQGGIADMARAMAPSTDMNQNTGVQMMYAGGPVKKMAKGDKVVRSGVVYIEQEDGSYLGEDGSPVDPNLAADDRTFGQRYIGDPLRELFQPVGAAARETLQPVGDTMRETLQPVGQDLQTLFDPRLVEPPAPTSEFTAADINAAIEAAAAKNQTARTMEAIQAERAPPAPTPEQAPTYPGWGADSSVAPYSSLKKFLFPGGGEGPSGMEEMSGLPPEVLEQFAAEQAAAESAAGGFGDMAAAAEQSAKDAAAARGAAGITESLKTQEEVKAAAEAAKTAVDTAQGAAVEDKTPPGETTPSGGAGGAGGAGSASSYEQALMDALSSREKAAEQDKWLALAQVGLNLMSSTQPTLGGALGEAGLKGVEAARGARDQYDKEKLEILGALEQSRMARAKAARSGASGGLGGISAGQGRLFTQINADIARLDTILNNPMLMGAELTPEDEMQLASARQQRDTLLAYRQQLLYGAPLGTGEDETSADLADQ
jgi:hypothetical protein